MILASSYPYTGNGLGGLSDAIECIVTHEINGQYELFMRYPITGIHYDELGNGKIIMGKPDDFTDEQPFRIYRITKPLNGVVSIYARHICYDCQGIIVEPFSADSLTTAISTVPTKCTPSSPITLQTTRSVASSMTIKEPRPLWKLLGGQAGSFLDVYGGEWEFDKLTAKLVTQLGQDRGVSIRYGKNLTQLEQDGTIESTYSGVFPWWYDAETNTLVTLTEKYVAVAGSIVTDRLLSLDCSDDFDTQPTEQDLRDRANAYITANSVGNLKSSWKVSFVDTEDFIDKVALGDTLHVFYEALGVNATARAVKTEYDVLKGKYKSITVGRVKQNLASIIVSQNEETEQQFKNTKSDYESKIDEATYSITHGAGTFRIIYNGYDIQEILSLDNSDLSQALSVWRWNNGGFGHSSTGYAGPYTLALLPDGSINASMITTGTLNANVIRAGLITDALGYNSWNLDTGAFSITNGSINISTAYETQDIINLNYTDSYGNKQSAEFMASGLMLEYWDHNSQKVTQSVHLSWAGIYIDNYDDPNDPSSHRPKSQYTSWGFILYSDFDRHKWIEVNNNSIDIYDSTGTKKQTFDELGIFQFDSNGDEEVQLDKNGLVFSSNGTQTGVYPADPTTFLQDNDIGVNKMEGCGFEQYSSTGTTTVTLQTDHTYLVTLTRRNSTDASYNAVWLVSSHTNNSNVATIKSGTGSSASISGLTLSITRGTAYSRVTWTRLA